jgi:hypothetical protein
MGQFSVENCRLTGSVLSGIQQQWAHKQFPSFKSRQEIIYKTLTYGCIDEDTNLGSARRRWFAECQRAERWPCRERPHQIWVRSNCNVDQLTTDRQPISPRTSVGAWE